MSQSIGDAASRRELHPEGRGSSDQIVDAKGKALEGPSEVNLQMAAAEGNVYVRLPSGSALELSPEQAKSLGGGMINKARAAKKQRKKRRRREAPTTDGS